MSILRPRNLSDVRLGTILVIVAIIVGVVLFQKQRVSTSLTPGEHFAAEFANNHRLTAFRAEVKIAGIPIGRVTKIQRTDTGTTRLEFKVKKNSLALMGSEPSAAIRPATLLGGNYYIDVVPGGRRGEFHGTIPVSRTHLPVELDRVAAALNAPARVGLRSAVDDLGGTFDEQGRQAVQDLTAHLPETLRPAAGVLESARGTNPGSDLPKFVTGFETTSRVLSEQNGQLDSSVRNLAKTTAVLDARRDDLRDTVHRMPDTLKSTNKMLGKLDKTLDTLEDTSDDIRPSVRKLDDVLEDLDPVLVEGRPVISDLRVVARDLRPVLGDLVPIADDLTVVLNNLEGPVLDRTNGKILPALNSGFDGTGMYADPNRADHPLYKEIGYTFTNLTQANMMDKNGSMVSFSPAVGPGSVVGLPISGEQLLQLLFQSGGAK